MIDALSRAYARIYNTIPMPILEAAFRPYESDMSIDALIKERVLIPRVKDDLSTRAGKVLRLILQLDWCEYTYAPSPYALGVSGSYSTYRIPPETREFRDIACVMSVRFPYTIGTSSTGTFYNDISTQGNTAGGLGQSVLQSKTMSNLLVSPTGVLRPGNIISLNPQQYNFVPWMVYLRVCFDDNFSGLDVSEDIPFAQLCEYAVKAYIYTNLIFAVESNMVYRGMELGVFKDQIQNYSDANEKYDEALIACGGANIYDADRLKGILSRMVPPRG